MWKLLSETLCTIFYLLCTPILRYGYNKSKFGLFLLFFPFFLLFFFLGFFPYNELVRAEHEYLITIYYSLAHFGVVIISLSVGYFYVKYGHPRVYEQVRKIHTKLFREPHYIAFVTTIFLLNGVITLSFLTYHNRVWFTFLKNSGFF